MAHLDAIYVFLYPSNIGNAQVGVLTSWRRYGRDPKEAMEPENSGIMKDESVEYGKPFPIQSDCKTFNFYLVIQ